MLPSNLFKPLKRIPLPLLIAIAAILLIVLLFTIRPTPEVKPQADIIPEVSTIHAQFQSHRPVVTLYGKVESPHSASLSATVNAYVKTLLTEEGARVEAGQILLELDDHDVQLAFVQRQAEVDSIEAQIESEKQRHANDIKSLAVEKQLLALAEKSANRYELLVTKNMGSDLSRDEALQKAQTQALSLYSREYAVLDHPNRLKQLQSQLDKSRAVRDQAALDLVRTRITAPFSGRITRINVAPGDRVQPGNLLISLFDQDHVEVRAQIPSRYLSQIEQALNQNQALDATLKLDGDTAPLTLQRLAGAIGTGQGGVDGLFSLKDAQRFITLGRAGEVALHMPAIESTLAVPPTSVYGQQRIYTVKDGILHTQMIERLGEVLTEQGRWQLIRADIPEGSAVLTTQLSNAVGGLAVKPRAPANE